MATNWVMRVSSRRKCVCMSIMNWSFRASARSCAIAGVAASAFDTSKSGPYPSFIATNEAPRPAAVLKEGRRVDTSHPAGFLRHCQQALLDLTLLLVLRVRVVFVAGNH